MKKKLIQFKNKLIEITGTVLGLLWIFIMFAVAMLIPVSLLIWCIKMIMGVL